MTATIYNGRGAPDAARAVAFSLPAGDYSGLALAIDFLGNRIPAEIDGEGRCTATIPEEAIRAIPCGTHRAALLLRGTNGQEAVFASVPIRVTDIPGEASAYADVTATTPSFAPANAVTASALAQALAAIDAPGTGATQRTLRETLAALVTALKSLSPAVALACLSLLGGAAAGEAIPWERVPPDTPVDPDALLPVDETDPTVPAWAKSPTPPQESDPTVPEWAKSQTPPLSEESDPVFAEWVGTNSYIKSLPKVNGVQMRSNVYVSGGQWLDVNINTETQVVIRAGGVGGAITNINTQIGIDVVDGLFDEMPSYDDLEYLYGDVTNYTDSAVSAAAQAATNYTDSAAAGKQDVSYYTHFLRPTGGMSEYVKWLLSFQQAPALAVGNEGNAREALFTLDMAWITHTNDLYIATNYTDSAVSAAAQAATNYTDAAIAAIDIPDPDYSQSNAVLVATIEAVAPAPGDYAAVSNAAMSAVQPGDFPAIESDPVWDGEKANYATKTDVQSVEASVNLVAMMVQGSNVVAEVTNYNSRVHAPALRLLQLNESNEYFQVWAETNGLARTLASAAEYADGATNALAAAKADRAWSHHTSGLGADAPDGYTWMSTPNTVLAGGLEFEKHATANGAIWILASNGMAADFHAQTNNTAFLDLSSADGTPVFRVEKTDSYLVGVDTTSVSVSGDTLVCGVSAVAAEHPLVRVKASLADPEWAKEEDGIPASMATVQWSGSSGAWVCEITNNTGGNSFFATMEYLQEGGTKIINSAPLDVPQGILCTDGVHRVRPVYDNGAVTWEVVQ